MRPPGSIATATWPRETERAEEMMVRTLSEALRGNDGD